MQRTPQTPFEMAAAEDSDEATWEVESIKSMRWMQGERQYLVKWQGFAEKDNSWEPMANLVGCAAQIREYEAAREAQDKADKEALLKRRQKAREEAEARTVEERRAAREAAFSGFGGEVDSENPEDEENDAKKQKTQSKSSLVWGRFDLTQKPPTCKCLTPSGKLQFVIPHSFVCVYPHACSIVVRCDLRDRARGIRWDHKLLVAPVHASQRCLARAQAIERRPQS